MGPWAAVVVVEEAAADFIDNLRVIRDVFRDQSRVCELVLVANGTGPHVRDCLEAAEGELPPLTLLEFSGRSTMATCLGAVLSRCAADRFLITGSYQKITRGSLGELLGALDGSTDLVAPDRRNRVDPGSNQAQSRAFNALVRWITRTPFRDLNCNVRAVRRQVLEEVDLYGDMYRFLPILALERGFRVREVPCDHHVEHGRVGFFGFREYAARLVDIAVLFFRTGHARKPLRFFGAKGAVSAGLGALVLFAVGTGRAAGQSAVGNNPWLFFGLILVLLGVQLVGIGLVGEILAFTYGRHKKDYVVERVL